MQTLPEQATDDDSPPQPFRTARVRIHSLWSAAIFLPPFAATYCGAYLLRFAGESDTSYWSVFATTVGIAIAVKWLAFSRYRVYESWTRYANFHDFVVLGKAFTVSTVGLTLIDSFALSMLQIPRSVLLIDWGLTLVAIGAARALPRLIRDDGLRFLAPQRGVRSLNLSSAVAIVVYDTLRRIEPF